MIRILKKHMCEMARPYLEMTWEVLLVEGMVVNLDLGESSEVVWHQHDGHVDVLQLPEMYHSILSCLLSVIFLFL